MAKSLFIAEKPSVAQEFAKALKEDMRRSDGFMESESYVVTWCVGHLVTMSYPDKYDKKYKRWSLDTLPFLPDHFLYEVIPSARKQFQIVSSLLNRPDVDTIYVCTDSGREGEYIYRLVEQESKGHVKEKNRLRVWIDSQTEEEIHRGIAQARDESAYDNLAAAAYLRAQEDYLMGINFSRLLTLKYGDTISGYLKTNRTVISVGRVMTCVLGMVVRREREIRAFVKTPFYRVVQEIELQGHVLEGEFRAVEGSDWYLSPKLYKENGFRERIDAQQLTETLLQPSKGACASLVSIEKKREKKNPPLLYNLAELQNDCSRMFKISPDATLQIVQELYEKKLVTYPRTDARVLSTAVAKEIDKNIAGLKKYEPAAQFAEEILSLGMYRGIEKTWYVNDKQITDHYAIIPTGQGMHALGSLKGNAGGVYALIVRRFLSIFYPAAEYQRISMVTAMGREKFFCTFRVLTQEGYFKVAGNPNDRRGKSEAAKAQSSDEKKTTDQDHSEAEFGTEILESLKGLRRGALLPVKALRIREGETSPPKRFNSGSMILAMENAGQLIEDEDLRAQIKGSGIGTSATRADILKKLVSDDYLSLNKKTQILTPTLLGEMIFDVVYYSIPSLLNPELTASWEKGLTYVAEGSVTSEEYMAKLDDFIRSRTERVRNTNNQNGLRPLFDAAAVYHRQERSKTGGTKEKTAWKSVKSKTSST